MKITVEYDGKNYRLDLGKPLDVTIPIRFDDQQMMSFGVPPATALPFQAGSFTGSVAAGAGCNCEVLSFSAHLHGTHTECVGHIANVPIYVHDILKDSLIPATLITVFPKEGRHDSNTYIPKLCADDTMITKDHILHALLGCNRDFLEALIVRTLPNAPEKRTQNYSKHRPPFFSIEAIRTINDYGVKHLLVDIPSIDRLDDEGKLTNHHIFWGVEQGSHAVGTPSPKTVTELGYVPDTLESGSYLLNLQLAPMAADASPSRPLLYEVKKL